MNKSGITRYKRGKLLLLLVNRTVILLSIMCILALFLYAIGTAQDFTDTAQIELLRFITILAIFLVTTSLSGLVINLVRFFVQRKSKYLFRSAFYLLPLFLGSASLTLVMFIFTLSSGS